MNFNFETIGYKNQSARELSSKKYSIFLRFMTKNDVKGFNWFKNLTLFWPWNVTNVANFFRQKFVHTRVLIANCFKIEIH